MKKSRVDIRSRQNCNFSFDDTINKYFTLYLYWDMLAKIININYFNYNYPINLVRHEEISHASETIKNGRRKKE